MIKVDSETITTGAGGAAALSLSTSKKIIGGWVYSYSCSFYIVNNQWAVEIFYGGTNSLIPSANASHTVTYYYVD